ncbi:MAG: UDP-N-acetylmuramate dehydrogenase [Anaerosomatales bacterium]|nr:UDP-N-acetylmuramate dehydrogenase [Anaerosomatales bacterium]
MGAREAFRRLSGRLSGEVRRDEPMSRHTTYRIGGPADLYLVCDTTADLKETLAVLAEEGVPHAVVGKGSNLLVSDDGYRGAVLTLGKEFKRHAAEGDHIRAGAACILAYLVQDAFNRGLAGLEFAVGIPGTLGGALAMNAGSSGEWMDGVVESVTVYSAERGLERLHGNEIAWGYRRSDLPERGIIVEGVLRAVRGDAERIRRVMETSLARRKRTQPMGVASAGSVFVNPPDDSAGRLIEAAGLKGMRLGGARVSTVHGNFIVNEGGATAADVLGLIDKIRMVVKGTYGIDLRTEIRFLGEF